MTFPNGYGVTPMGIMVGLPTTGRKVAFEWAINIANLNFPVMTHRQLRLVWNKHIVEARTIICKDAIQANSKYILFIDDDVSVPPHAARRLLYDLEQDDDVGIAVGIYCSKEEIPQPMVFKELGNGGYWQWKVGETFEVAAAGTGCMMIRTEILKEIPEPWFQTMDRDPVQLALNEYDNMQRMTDDIYFCTKVKEHTKYKIIADGNIICLHYNYDTDPPIPTLLPLDSYPMRNAIVNLPQFNIIQVKDKVEECQLPQQN